MPIDRRAEQQIREVENFHRQLTNFAQYIETVQANLNVSNYEALLNIPREVRALNLGFAKVEALNITPERYRKILEFRLLYDNFSESEQDFNFGMFKAGVLREFIRDNSGKFPVTYNISEEPQWLSAPADVRDQISVMISAVLEHYSD